MRAKLGTDRNIAIQYASWVGPMLTLDFGDSFDSGNPVSEDLAQRIPISLQLTVMSLIISGIVAMAFLARVTRSAMLEVLIEDYIRTARAKGLPEKIVIYRHALKNAVLPAVTIFGLALGNAASGSVVIEIIFGIPGMGLLLIGTLKDRDFPMIQAIVVIFGVMALAANLLIDLTYAWLNPRIRYN